MASSAKASSDPEVEGADNAFDGNSRTKWFSGGGHASGSLQADFGAGDQVTVARYHITSANDVPERDPKDWQFQGSNDGANWTTLDTQSGETFPARFYEMEYAVAKPAAYRYYRLNITTNSGAPALQIADIKLLSNQPMSKAPVAALIHWRANDRADREQAIAPRKADKARR